MIPEFSPWVMYPALALVVVGLVLIVLKLFGFIGLSWWWVLLPFAPFVILIALLVALLIAMAGTGGFR